MPRLKNRTKAPANEVAVATMEKVPTRCCVVCYNDFTPFPFASDKWSSNMIKNFYIALNIPWLTSGEEDGEDEEVVYLPFCPQCHTKVSVMQTYQIELQNLQAKFNSVRNDLAFAVVQSIEKHSKDGPIVQIRQQIFEKWKLTFQERQKAEHASEEIGLEYIAHEPSSRPHVCGIHFCNCQREGGAEASSGRRPIRSSEQKVDAPNLQQSFVGPPVRNVTTNVNGNSIKAPVTFQQRRRSVGMNGSMPVLSKMVGSPIKGQASGRNSTSAVPRLIPFRSSLQQRQAQAFDRKFPVIPNLSTSSANLNLSMGGADAVDRRQNLQPPALTFIGQKASTSRGSLGKFPGGMSSKFNDFGGAKFPVSRSDIQPRVPSHIVARTPIRQPRKFGVRTTGTPTARQRIMQGASARNAFRARLSGNMKTRADNVGSENGPIGSPPKQGKRKLSSGSFDFVEPLPKQSRVSGNLSLSPKRGNSKRGSSGNIESESLDDNDVGNIASTRGSPRSPNKSSNEFMPTLLENGFYQCQWCPKLYSSLSRIRRHGSFEHPEKQKIQCEFESCNKGFTSDVAYKRHYQHQHKISLDGFVTMTCSICKKCFIKTSSFRTHLKSHGLSISQISLAVEAAEAQQFSQLPNEGEDEDYDEDEELPDELDDPPVAEMLEVNMEIDGEDNGVPEPVEITKPKRKITIQRPFNVRKRKRRSKNASPKVVVPPATTRRRNPKPVPVDPVRKSSRQRGEHIDIGLPMYPARRKRSNMKDKGAVNGEEGESPEVKLENNETEPENNEISVTRIKKENEAGENETNTELAGDQSSMEKPKELIELKVEGSRSDITTAVEVETIPSSSNLDDSFVRGPKSDMTIGSSPIRINMHDDNVFSSTPMVPRPSSNAAVESELECSINAPNANTTIGNNDGSTFSINRDSEDAAETKDNGDSSIMNTTYTLETTDDDGSKKSESAPLE